MPPTMPAGPALVDAAPTLLSDTTNPCTPKKKLLPQPPSPSVRNTPSTASSRLKLDSDSHRSEATPDKHQYAGIDDFSMTARRTLTLGVDSTLRSNVTSTHAQCYQQLTSQYPSTIAMFASLHSNSMEHTVISKNPKAHAADLTEEGSDKRGSNTMLSAIPGARFLSNIGSFFRMKKPTIEKAGAAVGSNTVGGTSIDNNITNANNTATISSVNDNPAALKETASTPNPPVNPTPTPAQVVPAQAGEEKNIVLQFFGKVFGKRNTPVPATIAAGGGGTNFGKPAPQNAGDLGGPASLYIDPSTQSVTWDAWRMDILSKLEGGDNAERIACCERLQVLLKGSNAKKYRSSVAGHRVVPQLLGLCRHVETARAAMYTLQLIAAAPDNTERAKLWMDECGCMDALCYFLVRKYTASSDGDDRLIAHIVATLVNMCIGAPDRKDQVVRYEGITTRLVELLYNDEAPQVQLTCANLTASLAIGCQERKHILGTKEMFAALARLLRPNCDKKMQYQAVVSFRALMHNIKESQLYVAQIPGVLSNLKALLPTAGTRKVDKFQKEVVVAVQLLTLVVDEARKEREAALAAQVQHRKRLRAKSVENVPLSHGNSDTPSDAAGEPTAAERAALAVGTTLVARVLQQAISTVGSSTSSAQ